MQAKASMKTNNAASSQKNTFESLKELGSSVVKNTADSFKNMGAGMFDQLLGNYGSESSDNRERAGLDSPSEKKAGLPKRKEFTLFSYREYYESQIVRQKIKELTELIAKEIEMLKKADQALLAEAKDIERLSINALPDKPGIYHVRFLEIVLTILRSLRAKVGESRTWMQALLGKKKKRGSLFAAISKKKGTQYSLSQELSTARSVQ